MRGGGGWWEGVVDGGVLRVEFAGDVGFGDGGSVMRREMVALEAEGTHPDLGGVVDATERVECCDAGLATKWRVGERD